MKKIILLFMIILFFGPIRVSANELVDVSLVKCVDGDTAKFNMKGKEVTTRFLAVDTQETKHPKKGEEPFGKEASNYTCSMLTNASSIVLEYDDGSAKTDKYDRHLVWVYTDNELLQKKLIEKGYAKVAYLYGDYQYTSELQKIEKTAQEKQIGIWGDYVAPKDYTLYYILGGVIAVVFFAFMLPNIKNKEIKKIASKGNRKIKRDLKKNFKKMMK